MRANCYLGLVFFAIACGETSPGPDGPDGADGGNGSVSSGGRAAGGRTTGGGAQGGGSASGGAEPGKTGGSNGIAVGGLSTIIGGAQAWGGEGGGPTVGDVRLPAANAPFDYQIGEPYTPPDGVQVVSRDHTQNPAQGLYNICYVNGFQTQPDANSAWLKNHKDLVLHDKTGNPVEDEDWGEYLLDTSTDAKRQALLDIFSEEISDCATSGFDAVEVDNLDSYSRSGGLLDEDDNVAFIRLLSDFSHQAGLAVGQKNSSELLSRRSEMGTDFAVAEECNRWDECDGYRETYAGRVFIIEYREVDFDKGCKAFPELSIVLRDRDVTAPGSGTYVFDGC